MDKIKIINSCFCLLVILIVTSCTEEKVDPVKACNQWLKYFCEKSVDCFFENENSSNYTESRTEQIENCLLENDEHGDMCKKLVQDYYDENEHERCRNELGERYLDCYERLTKVTCDDSCLSFSRDSSSGFEYCHSICPILCVVAKPSG